MDVSINWLGVLLGGVSSMVIGALYYSDQAFGKQWKKLAKITVKQYEQDVPKLMPIMFAGALINALVVAYMTTLYQAFFGMSWLVAGLTTSLIIWLPVAVGLYIHNILDQRPSQITAISVGNRLLSLLAMGAIIGWLHP